MTIATDLIERLRDEGDLCKNDGADDIASLLWEAADALSQASAPSVQVVPPSANWRASQYGERWVVECHMPCINGLCAWVTVADLGQPEVEDEMFGGLDREGIAKRIAAALSATPVKASAQPAAEPGAPSRFDQASADWARDGVANFVADHWPDRKHTLAEIEAGIRAIEIRVPLATPTPPSPTASAGDGAQEQQP